MTTDDQRRAPHMRAIIQSVMETIHDRDVATHAAVAAGYRVEIGETVTNVTCPDGEAIILNVAVMTSGSV